MRLPIIPLRGKVPAVKGWQFFQATAQEIEQWWGRKRANIGMRTGESGYIVIDVDTARAEDWVRRKGILNQGGTMACSGGGLHVYTQCPEGVEVRNRQWLHGIEGLDIRGHGGYIVLPPSIHPDTGARYRWITKLRPPTDQPRFDPKWLAAGIKKPTTQWEALEPRIRGKGQIRNVMAYIMAIPSIQGANGSNACFRVACLLRDMGMSPAAALSAMEHWNACCTFPPWSRKELDHKVTDAFKVVRR